MAPTSPLHVEGLRYRWPDGFALAVDEVSVEAGEAVALVGPSGGGKSTFLSLAAGILTPDAGVVSVDGTAWGTLGEGARRARRRRRVGLVFQEFELLDHLDATENVLLPLLVAGDDDGAARERAGALLDAAGVSHLARRKPRRMSHGERQRVAVCRALVTRPALVLADEPTGNLDADSARRVLELLRDQARLDDAALVVVTHDTESAATFDRVLDAREWA